ncbi:MAG TPA: 30S ribosomal protein S16 [Phycisphaerae bacterium]|nr:30S ribosomal protein S16 [Phycisphaerae bacterium]HRY68162.1 30S ribosomal protein S16 [Phycisphaerae bacterium]HSA27058.1 30S ribosomal protein S16 [Phycisphaerae bacterium]
MVRIRLKRTGRAHKLSFRVTAVDIRRSRDGRVIEELGFYNPAHRREEWRCNLKMDRIQYWLSVGAQPSETVRNLLTKTSPAEPAKA